MARVAALMAALLAFGGCGVVASLAEPPSKDAGSSAPRPDAAQLIDGDAGRLEDAGGDGGRLDAGRFDGGRSDAGRSDSGTPDAGAPDGGLDGGAPDGGLDGGVPDAGLDAGPLCGNGTLEPGEDCEDGNLDDRDGCSSECTLWWDTRFATRVRFDLQSPVDEVVTGVPIALEVPAEHLPESGAAGALCAVASDHETELPLELEGAADGAALVWVRLDELPIGASEVYLYVGDASLCVGAPASAVWSGHYRAVWHFGSVTDSAADIPVGPAGSGVSLFVSGLRGAAASVSSSSWLEVSPPGELWITGDLTLEAWVRLDAFGSATSWENTVFQAAGNAAQAYFFNVENDGRLRAYWEYETGFGRDSVDLLSDASFGLDVDEWHHVAMVRDDDARRVRFYVDGAQLGSTRGYSSSANGTPSGSSFVYLGGNFTDSGRRLNGLLDEVRVAAEAHSAAWIAVSHAATAGEVVVGAQLEAR